MTELGIGAKILGFFGGVPRWVYIALAVAALIGSGLYLHHRAVKSAYDTAYKAGGDAEAARVEKAAKKLEQRAAALTAKIRSKNDETNRRISADADDLRLRGSGKAACPGASSAAAVRYVAAGRTTDAAVGEVPDPQRVDLIAMPFADAISFAEQHDQFRAKVLSVIEQHDKLAAQAAPVQP
jgi:hypothetical protein